MLEAQQRAKEIRQRLMNPPNVMGRDPAAQPRPTPRIARIAEIEGMIAQLNAELDNLNQQLGELYTAGEGRPRIEDILNAVCVVCRVRYGDLISERRTANIVRPRQVAMYLAKELTLKSLPQIGRHMGNRDHTTILHGARKIGDLIHTDEYVQGMVKQVKRVLFGDNPPEDATCSSHSTNT